ncbi:hypothetical protein HJFPF1_09984 [Paramyrothecium foliicola]|nr:hypothetical protein HJFPF1_09984 [Paramyrothecium foliicola]
MNPFATPEGSAGDGSVAGSGTGSTTNPHATSGLPLPESSAASATESQPTLRDFPQPPSKPPMRVGRPPRAVAWSDKRSIISINGKYTFYRDPTPPPPEDRIAKPPLITQQSAYDYKYDHVAPPAPLPVATICGLRRRIFWIIVAAILLVIALAVGIGVGVGVGVNEGSTNGTSDAQASGSSTTTVISSSIMSDTPTTTTSNPNPTSTEPDSTSETSSASTVSSNPAITTLVSCPAANNTIFKVPGADTEFLRVCGVDYTGRNSAVDLGHAWTPTFEDCMILCAGYPECEGCGWGVIEGDPVLLRVLQHIVKFEGAHTEDTRIIFTSPQGQLEDELPPTASFTVAHIDLGGGPNTQMHIYSTWEDDAAGDKDEAEYEQQLNDMTDAVVRLRSEFKGQLSYPGSVLLGTLHSGTRQLLEQSGRVKPRATGVYDKWLFRLEDLPSHDQPLPEGMQWASATLQDCELAVARNNLPRPPHKLVRWQNLVIKLEDGTPVAWAFLDPDSSLCSLHCEEPYRGKGLAKLLGTRLLRDHTSLWGDDGWSMADVAPDNEPSRGFCKSLNGKPTWKVSWVLFNVEADPTSTGE